MESIQMEDFINFVLATGTGRLTAIRSIRDVRVVESFYKPLREAIVDMHEKGQGASALSDFLGTRSDARERRVFPKVVGGYSKFLRQGKMTWFEPPLRHHLIGPITVDVTPELGLLIDGRPHAIKLYMRGDPIAPQRMMLTNQLLWSAFMTTWPGTVCATLDVRRAKLYPLRPKPEIPALLRAEAACFSSLWGALS